ncbi:MAG: DUF1499 domain-containing protein [Bacteroidota bacterium]
MSQAQESSHILKECPSSPNCVSSVTSSDKHYMAPFNYTGALDDAIQKIKKVLSQETRVKITLEDKNYIRSEFKIALFGFIDDVEFLIDNEDKKIHFRSASRVGYSDLGVNKKRMIRIKHALEKLENEASN